MIERLPTDSPLDKILNGGLECGTITNVYGEAGSGKTNIALLSTLSCLRNKKKVVYIDTEGSFSIERFMQVGGVETDLENIIIFEPENWKEQCTRIKHLESLVKNKNIGLVVVDSLVALYRLELTDENYTKINRELATQYSILSRIARNYHIPILVTNQVYSKVSGEIEKIEMISNHIAKFWSKTLIELHKLDKDNHRLAILKKHRSMPEGKKVEFVICSNGLKESRFLI